MEAVQKGHFVCRDCGDTAITFTAVILTNSESPAGKRGFLDILRQKSVGKRIFVVHPIVPEAEVFFRLR
jgi:hypothetical protein